MIPALWLSCIFSIKAWLSGGESEAVIDTVPAVQRFPSFPLELFCVYTVSFTVYLWQTIEQRNNTALKSHFNSRSWCSRSNKSFACAWIIKILHIKTFKYVREKSHEVFHVHWIHQIGVLICSVMKKAIQSIYYPLRKKRSISIKIKMHLFRKTNLASTAVRIRNVNATWIRHKQAWGLGSFPPQLPLKEDYQSKTHNWDGNPEMKVAMVRPHVQDKCQLATIDASLELAADPVKRAVFSTKKDIN